MGVVKCPHCVWEKETTFRFARPHIKEARRESAYGTTPKDMLPLGTPAPDLSWKGFWGDVKAMLGREHTTNTE